MKRYFLTMAGIGLPVLLLGALTLNQTQGTLIGKGHARAHGFPVIAQTFEIEISDPDDNGERSLTVTVPIKDITTKRGLRNKHMRSSMFDLAVYPDIIFSAVINTPIEAGEYNLEGTLTINGIEKPQSLTITIKNVDEKRIASGSAKVILTDFDLPLVGMGPMKVLNHVEMEFSVVIP